MLETLLCDTARQLRTDCILVMLFVLSIQAAWRGYIVRCWYHKLRKTNPPKDPNLRQKFYQEKVRVIAD